MCGHDLWNRAGRSRAMYMLNQDQSLDTVQLDSEDELVPIKTFDSQFIGYWCGC